MKKYIALILIVVSLLACTKTLDFDDEGIANNLVFNGIIQSGDDFKAMLSRSTSILTEPYGGGMIAGGTMELYENGTLLSTVSSPFGQFLITNFKPKAGANYRILVNSENETVESETTIPARAEVISLDSMTVTDENYTKRMNYQLKFKDQAGDDYYRIVITTESMFMSINSADKVIRRYFIQKNEIPFDSGDPVFKSLYNTFGGDILDIGPNNSYHIFSDDYFKGKEYSIQLLKNNYFSGGDYFHQDPGNPSIYQGRKRIYERNIVHIQKLSKELFLYLKYLKLYEFYHDDPFAEPVPVYSNIKNGVGIFAGLNDDARFNFEKIYLPYSMDSIKIEEDNYNTGGYSY